GGFTAVGQGPLVGLFSIEDGQGDILDAVAEELDVPLSRMIIVKTGREQEADIALGEQVGRLFARAGGEIGNLLDLKAKAGGVEIGRLLGVADVKANVVDINQMQRVA